MVKMLVQEFLVLLVGGNLKNHHLIQLEHCVLLKHPLRVIQKLLEDHFSNCPSGGRKTSFFCIIGA